MFYGIAAPAPGAAIIKATDSYLTVEHNQFLGSAACQSGRGLWRRHHDWTNTLGFASLTIHFLITAC